MDFFNDLLTSYSLLKKRKFKVSLTETRDMGEGGLPSFAELRNRANSKSGQDNTQAQTTIAQTIEKLQSIFPGIDIESGNIPGKQSLGVAPRIEGSNDLGDELKLTHPGDEPQLDLSPPGEEGSTGSSDNEVTPCSPGVIWLGHNGDEIITSKCAVNTSVLEWYRTKVAQFYWQGGEGGAELAQTLPEDQQYLQNSRWGSLLLSELGDNPEGTEEERLIFASARKDIILLMSRGWEDGKPINDFYNPESTKSIFAVLGKTWLKGQEEFDSEGNPIPSKDWIDIGTRESPTLVNVVANRTEVLGALVTMSKALAIVGDPNPEYGDISDRDRTWMSNNLFFVTSKKNKKQLYFNIGDGTGVNFTAAPGAYDSFLKTFEDYNGAMDKFDQPLGKISEVSRRTIFTRSEDEDHSTQVITDLSEDAAQILQLVEGRASNGRSRQARAKEAAKIYHRLQDTWGKNINTALRVMADLPEENLAITDTYDSFLGELELLVKATGGNWNDYTDADGNLVEGVQLDTKRAMSKLLTLMRQDVLAADADYILRVGTGGGKLGFKSDQVYLYKADADGKARAKKFQGRGFKGEPQSARAWVEKQVARNKKEDPSGDKYEANKKKAWKDFKERWGVDSKAEDEEVFVGYDTIKTNVEGKGFKLGTGKKVDQVPGALAASLEGHLQGTLDNEDEAAWVESMLKVTGTRGEKNKDGEYTDDVLPKVVANLKSIDRRFAALSQLENATSQSLTIQQVRREVWQTLGETVTPETPGTVLLPDVSDTAVLRTAGLSRKELDSIVMGPSNASEKLMSDGVRRQVLRKLLFGSLKSGMTSPDPAVSKSWEHTTALLMADLTVDRDDAWDSAYDQENNQKARHQRNTTVEEVVTPFLENPSENIEWHGTKFNVVNKYKGKDGKQLRGNRIGYTVNSKDGTVSANLDPNPEYWSTATAATNDSIEYSPTELMNKLLEVQQLMFSHLIKE